jgi:hypothetical protein
MCLLAIVRAIREKATIGGAWREKENEAAVAIAPWIQEKAAIRGHEWGNVVKIQRAPLKSGIVEPIASIEIIDYHDGGVTVLENDAQLLPERPARPPVCVQEEDRAGPDVSQVAAEELGRTPDLIYNVISEIEFRAAAVVLHVARKDALEMPAHRQGGLAMESPGFDKSPRVKIVFQPANDTPEIWVDQSTA